MRNSQTRSAGPRQITYLAAVTTLACAMAAGAAHATTVFDPAGDRLSTFTNTDEATPDLDVVRATAVFNKTQLILQATMAGKIGTSDKGVYIWGIDRGAGTDLLAHPTSLSHTDPPIGHGVTFDSFIELQHDGSGGFAVLLGAPGSNPLDTPDDPVHPTGVFTIDSSWVGISGRTITLKIDRDLLTSQGFDFAHYGYNIWPRYGDTSDNNMVTDFAPNVDLESSHNTFEASATPEPAAWAFMIMGFGLIGTAMRRRQLLPTA